MAAINTNHLKTNQKKTAGSYLTIKEWRIIICIQDFHRKWTNAFKTRFTGIHSFDSHTDLFAILALTVKHFIGKYFPSFFVNIEFGTFLIRLLDNAITNLAIDTLVFVNRMNLDYGTTIGSSFFDFWRVRCTILKNRLK